MSETTAPPAPDRIFQLTTGAWATALAGAGVTHGIFTRLSSGPATAADVAQRTGLSPRGARTLLDGLTGLGLLTTSEGRYANAPDADAYLVEGRPRYLGAYVAFGASDIGRWADLAEVVRTGVPTHPDTAEVPDNPFWERLVPAILALAAPVAEQAARSLSVADGGPLSLLDIGGGSGIWSIVFLRANREARARQLDWANVNRIARRIVDGAGVGDRFETVDGDFRTTDLGQAAHDVVVLSNIAHQESPSSNRELFGRIQSALKPGGVLVISDFVVDDGRAGPPFALLFASVMLLNTRQGSTYTASEFREWLGGAGFSSVQLEKTPGPTTIVYARTR
jgi:predicted O-methyltransferase YrrM